MICRQGPLDGCDIPDTHHEFFLFSSYTSGEPDEAIDSSVVYVYGAIRGEWHYQPSATNVAHAAVKGRET